MTSSDEIWRDIPGYEGRYQASDHGRIRSLDQLVRCGNGGKGTRLCKGRVLRPAGQQSDPHLRVTLGNKAPSALVHVLVALTFIGPRPEGCDVRHLDGDPQNNRADNLAYGTRRENILDVYRTGRPWRKLTTDQVLDIRNRLAAGEKGRVLAHEYGVKEACISAIKTGRTYSWLK